MPTTDTAAARRFAGIAVTIGVAVTAISMASGCANLPDLPQLLGGGVEYLLIGHDMVCYPGQLVQLTARLQHGNRLADVRDAQIIFTTGSAEIGRAMTDSNGYARLAYRAGDQAGHQIIHCQPADPQIAEGTRSARMLISAIEPDTALIVVDLDGTVVSRQWRGVLTGSADPIPGAAEAVQRIQQHCECQIIYLTGRPVLLKIRSRDWLDSHDFPLGPLLVSEDVLLRSASQRDYKIEKLNELRSRFRNIRAGVGDKIGDAAAYLSAGVPLSVIIAPADTDGEKVCRNLMRMRQFGSRSLVVGSWQDAVGVLLGQ